MQSEPIGEILAIATTFLWATSATCFEYASNRIGSLAVNVIRLSIAVVLLGLVSWYWRGQFWPVDATRHVWIWVSLSGVLGFFICDMCLFESFVLHGAKRSSLVMATAPIYAALMDWLFLGKPVPPIGLLGMALTLSGVMWVVLSRKVAETSRFTPRGLKLGLVLAFIAAVGQALGASVAERGMVLADGSKFDPIASTFIRCLAGMFSFIIFLSAIGYMPKVMRGLKDRRAISVLSLGAVAGPVIGVTCFMASMQHIQPAITQTIVGTMPILMLGSAAVIHKERITLREIVGVVLAVVGVVLLSSAT